ncbi:GTP cyclohydrolase I FolE [Halanaerobaculum tunisiense]
MKEEQLKTAVENILEAVGENPQRAGLEKTPQRVAKMYQEIFSGLGQDPVEVLEVLEEDTADDLVVVNDISFYSVCEHHLLPFYGQVHIGYQPQENRVTGFSKLAKLVEVVARRPQLQERMTNQIADTIGQVLEPAGVYVVIEAEQLCMTMRGIKQTEAETITAATRGSFKEDAIAKQEVLNLLGV